MNRTVENGRDKERKEEKEQEDPAAKSHANYNDERWESIFRRLKAFKSKYGHTQIPYRYPEDPKLGRWGTLCLESCAVLLLLTSLMIAAG
jgi:Helicase associated domain